MPYDLVPEILRLPKPEEPKRKRIEQRRTTLHRRDLEHIDFYVIARFVHGLITVRTETAIDDKTTMRIPQVLDLGNRILYLPEWEKTGKGWVFAELGEHVKPAICVSTHMMRAIGRYVGLRESAMVNALYKLSMVSVIGFNGEGRPRYRQRCKGRFINPADGQKLNFAERELEGFVLDGKRVREWIDKELNGCERSGD